MPATVIIPGRTSEIGAAHLMVSLTMTDAPTHGLPGHAGVGAGVVGLVTNVQAVLVGIITTHRDVTERGLGQLPTFTAAYITIRVQGAALPAAVGAKIKEGIDSVRSAVTVTPVVARIPAHGSLSVVAGVGVAGACRVTRVAVVNGVVGVAVFGVVVRVAVVCGVVVFGVVGVTVARGERAASPAVAPLALAALVLSRLVHLSRAPGLRLKLHHYLLCV